MYDFLKYAENAMSIADDTNPENGNIYNKNNDLFLYDIVKFYI